MRRLLAASKMNEDPMSNVIEEIEHAINDPVADEGLGRYLSEDWFFCQRWLDLGGEVWADCCVAVRHIGPVVFPLETQIAQMTNPDVAKDIPSPSSGAAA